MWRRPLVSLALLGALLTGCSHHSSGRGATSTSRTGGSSGDTLSTTGPPPSGVHGVWFASDKEGWALAEEPCPKPGPDPAARCAAVWKTSDGAETWTRLTGLDVPPKGAAGTDAVDAVRFADAQHGWVYDRSLLATFSGGKRWQPVDLGAPVTDVEVAGSQAYALVGACDTGAGNCTEPMRIAEGTIATGRWRFAGLGFDMPATDTGTLIANRSSIYAWVTGPSAQLFLARTTAGRWERRTPPCARPIVAPITDEDGLVAACLPAMNAGPVELQTSSDGGRSWAVVWHSSFARTVTSLAVTGTAAVVGLENGDVLRTTDNGMHFVSVLRSGGNAELQFVDGDHGFATAGPDGRRQLFSTDDGGATWKALRPPA